MRGNTREPARRAVPGRVAVGHPVDVATGEQFTACHDAEVPGAVPLLFRRFYSTRLLDREPSVLGPGWVHGFEATLTRDLDGFLFEGHDGERIELDDVDGTFAATGRLLDAAASMELRREGERLVIYHWHGPDDPVLRLVFDPRHGDRMLLVARELPSGQGLLIGRDALGRVATVTQTTEQRRLYFAYDERGLLSSLRLGLASRGLEAARVVGSYTYDAAGRLVAVRDALGHAREYGYDDGQRLIRERDRRGGEFHMSYDAQGRCIESTGLAGYQRRQFIYEPRRTRVIDSQGHETVYEYNALGQVTLKTLPNGAKFGCVFDELGRITCETDALGAVTAYAYDAIGRVSRKTSPNGGVVSYEYDDQHQPTRIVDPDGAALTLRYERGALAEARDAYDCALRYVRDQHNALIGALTSGGREVRIRNDDEHTMESVEDEHGLILRERFDVYRQPVVSEDAAGLLETNETDALGRSIRTTFPDGSFRALRYDPEGAIEQLTDARGGVWRARYSSYGNCVEHVDPIGRMHRYEWDTEGRLASITNPSSMIARFTYDCVGNLTAIQHFDGRIELGTYDLVGRLSARRRADGSVIELERDALGNLLAASVDGAMLQRFEYDVCGRPIQAASAYSENSYEYAVGGRLVAEMQGGRRITFDYDHSGRLARRHLDGTKAGAMLFRYDSRDRLRAFSTEVSAAASDSLLGGAVPARAVVQSFEYDVRDRCSRRKLGPHTEARHYDHAGRLRHQEIAGVVRRSYEYDAEGALTALEDASRGRNEYQYDPTEQLLSSVDARSGQHIYAYDASGNLTARDLIRLSYASGDRLRAAGGTSFERDANAQMTRQTSAERDDSYEWDALGQLIRVRHRDGSATRFEYDTRGRRTLMAHRPRAGSAADEVSTRYYWSGDELLAEQRGSLLTEYASWRSVSEAIWDDGQIRHVVNSQQGVPFELLGDDGKLLWRGRYDEFGGLVAQNGSASCRLRLPGQIADEQTGLHYNRFRYYLAAAAQFISPDPIRFESDTNSYRYAPNTISWIDRLGLYCSPNHPAPPNNNGVSPQHGTPPHDSVLRRIARRMVALGYGDVRVNQQQVNAQGQVVGRNRPDVSGTHPVTNQRVNIEIDTNPANSAAHQQVVPARDPNAVNTFVVIDPASGRPLSSRRIP